MVQGHQKWYSGLSNTQIHKYKYANTQIQHVRKCRKYPTYLYFWKANDTRTSKIIFWTVKYTNTQIQRHKCTNTLWRSAGNTQHVYIFKKPGIQGYQKWYSGLSKIQIHTRCDYYVSPNLKLWITDHWLTFALYHQVYLADFKERGRGGPKSIFYERSVNHIMLYLPPASVILEAMPLANVGDL